MDSSLGHPNRIGFLGVHCGQVELIVKTLDLLFHLGASTFGDEQNPNHSSAVRCDLRCPLGSLFAKGFEKGAVGQSVSPFDLFVRHDPFVTLVSLDRHQQPFTGIRTIFLLYLYLLLVCIIDEKG